VSSRRPSRRPCRRATRASPEHLLLTILAAAPDYVAPGLADLDLAAGAVREALDAERGRVLDAGGVRVEAAALPRGSGSGSPVPFAPQTKRALEQALSVALERRDHAIGVRHVLLGLLREPSTRIDAMLTSVGLSADELFQRLAGPGPR